MDKHTLIKDITLKDGSTYAKGEEFSVRWDREKPWISLLTIGQREIRVHSQTLPTLSHDFEAPDMSELDEVMCDGICYSMLGHSVEPDGWDHEGSPSWLLAMGMM